MNLMSSIQTQSLNLKLHHAQYPAIDPKAALKGSASAKIIFITGASQGIGQATAVAFAQAGAQAIYLTARSEEALRETKTRVSKANSETLCEYMVCDVTDEAQVKASIEDCVARFGGIDVVDSNAGYLDQWKKIGESDTTSWWKTWEVNLKGTYYVIRYTVSYLIESAKKHSARGSTSGHLILISSIGAQLVRPTASDYQTSKHAINRLCEFVNVDHGEEGIKCFAIHPGGVPTVLAKNMPKEVHVNLVDDPDLAAGFAVWLCSGKADWARGRYLSSNWDVDELTQLKDEILRDDLLVNRLRTKA
jgi:NAD(P)-dependent dehydrogenase (short-subunit alcohol dehydrogenase family)